MPQFVLKIKCELENMAHITLLPGSTFKFDVVSPSGEIRKGITFNAVDEFEIAGSKGNANFIMKWEGSSAQSYIKVVPIKKVDGSYTTDDSGKWKPVLGLECRGLDLGAWFPGDNFTGASTAGAQFDTIDLEEGDWTEYDERGDLSVSVMNLEFEIARA